MSKWERLVILALLGTFLFGLPAVFALPAELILFQPDSYKQAMERVGTYEQYPVWLGQLVEQGGERVLPGSGARLMSLVHQERYQEVVRSIFPPEWVREQSESLIDQFWAYFNFQDDQLRLVVNFRPVKAHLSGEDAPQIVSIIVQGLPPCTRQDLLEFGLGLFSGEADGLPACRPPDELVELSNLLVGGILQGTGNAMPEEIDLAAGLRAAGRAGGNAAEQTRHGWFDAYRLFRRVMTWSPWLFLACLAAVVVIGARTRRGLLFWTGIGLILPGLAGLITALLFALGSVGIVSSMVHTIFGSFVISDVLIQLLAEIGRRFLLASGLIGLGSFLIGLAMLGGAMWRNQGRVVS